MSRWIDADALIADMQERYCKPCKEKGEDYHEVRCRACWVDDAINDVDGFADNGIDVEPKRGEWQYICSGKWMFRRCSCCEWTQTYDDSKYMGYRYNFCPNCGAKMDGERRE